MEDAVGERELPPDLPSDDKLIAAGAAASVAAGAEAGDPDALAALKGTCDKCHVLGQILPPPPLAGGLQC